MNYPTSLDDTSSLPNPGATDKTNSPSHAGLHSDENAAIIALETKIGTGSSTPAANKIMFGTGTGTSAWTQLTSAELASSLSDETGSGSAVFQTSPTLNTPKVDTIQENTSGNGVTIDSLSIKDGKLNTNNSVVTSNITDSAVTSAKLAPTKSTDANGWTTYDYGTWKKYIKRFGPYTTGSIATLGQSTIDTNGNMPVSVAPNDVYMSNSWNNNSSNSSQLVIGPNGYDATSTSTSFTYSITLRNITGSSVTYTNVYFSMELTTK